MTGHSDPTICINVGWKQDWSDMDIFSFPIVICHLWPCLVYRESATRETEGSLLWWWNQSESVWLNCMFFTNRVTTLNRNWSYLERIAYNKKLKVQCGWHAHTCSLSFIIQHVEPIFCFNVTPSTGVQNAIDQGLLYKFYAHLSGRSKKNSNAYWREFPFMCLIMFRFIMWNFFHVSQMVLYGVNTG